MTRRPFIIDCDTGRDDALSIWASLARGLPLAAIVTSYGNVPLAQVTDNTLRVLALANRPDVPVLPGAARPSREHAAYRDIVLPRQAGSGNGLCDIVLPAPAGQGTQARAAALAGAQAPEESRTREIAALIRQLAGKHGKIDYVIIGPATNFAALCAALGEEARQIIGNVSMMGGKTGELWDIMPGPDFNIACDPYAVRDILRHGFPMRFITMNTTWPIAMPLAEIEALAPSSPLAAAARDIMIAYCRHFAPEPVFRFHDPVAVFAAVGHGLSGNSVDNFRPARLRIDCAEESAAFGRLAETNGADESGFPAFICDLGTGAGANAGSSLRDEVLAATGLRPGISASPASA